MNELNMQKKLILNRNKSEIKAFKGLIHRFLTMGGTFPEVDILKDNINAKINSNII